MAVAGSVGVTAEWVHALITLLYTSDTAVTHGWQKQPLQLDVRPVHRSSAVAGEGSAGGQSATQRSLLIESKRLRIRWPGMLDGIEMPWFMCRQSCSGGRQGQGGLQAADGSRAPGSHLQLRVLPAAPPLLLAAIEDVRFNLSVNPGTLVINASLGNMRAQDCVLPEVRLYL